ncbi:MAG TPA: bifunctional serine/threonine-protein kinase/formylglycine-generating enzyme family protein [Planctomycetota bacterium]|nr:bifunctional serine/threonine-protein kinase/formylglycine-generating enzyme family protein [Planctomycetota bacterium]
MSPPTTPLSFGPFELLEPLGGGMSIVYRARRTGDARELAVKLLRQERSLDGESRGRFARERRAMQQLSHPGICPLLDAGEVDGMPYLCMPLLAGRSFAAHLEDARTRGVPVAATLPSRPGEGQDWRRVVAITAALADALEVAHEHGFVHRDVKPANVWIDEHGEAMLLDFGLAHDRADRYRNLTRTGQVLGTPTYLAPEQLDPGLGTVDGRADVYGLAAVLCEALTLEPPFRGETRAELFANILTGQLHLRCEALAIPEVLIDLIRVGMARRQADRYPSAGAMAADLRRVLAGKPLAKHGPARVRSAVAWLRARPLRVAVAGVVLTGVGLSTSAFVRLAQAAESNRELQAASEVQVWLGRFELARSSHACLPPPWPQHRAALQAWLREHGRPLLAAPAEAERGAPDLQAFARSAVAELERQLVFLAALEARGAAADADRWAAARASVAADVRFAGHTLLPQPGLVPLGADPASHLEEFYDLASGDPALGVPQRDDMQRLVLGEAHGIVFVLLPGGRYQPFGDSQSVVLRPFLLAKHELTRAQHGRLHPGEDPNDVPLGEVWNGELQTLRHPVNRVPFSEAQARLRRWGFQFPTEVQWEYAARAGGADEMQAWAGNYSGDEDGVHRSARVGSYPANALGLHDMLGNVAEPCADADGARTLPARDGDGLRDAAPEQPRRIARGGSYGSIRWALTGASVLAADQREAAVGIRPLRALEQD